ncbi:hypothetical protein F4827_005056 [Paraburkholderia bannensis]|uniref:Uncharacterized protein n=1 Tax=Paraburkholderia bannensis TaxID=765414 RepID=A0A7W9U3H4_9BURK|nr:hypothetical protein [Paraburkholderia sp. WP4_3_2]MBB6105190.1 hypothetical protein [Paraburkholderia bannensis]
MAVFDQLAANAHRAAQLCARADDFRVARNICRARRRANQIVEIAKRLLDLRARRRQAFVHRDNVGRPLGKNEVSDSGEDRPVFADSEIVGSNRRADQVVCAVVEHQCA